MRNAQRGEKAPVPTDGSRISLNARQVGTLGFRHQPFKFLELDVQHCGLADQGTLGGAKFSATKFCRVVSSHLPNTL
jgi:hypothetical protein